MVDEISLKAQYDCTSPLLEYMRLRLKYDTVRWIRDIGKKDEIIFSTRQKEFERIEAKISKKEIRIRKSQGLLGFLTSEKNLREGLITDSVGIRFVCFSDYHVLLLLQHFFATSSVIMYHKEFYVSSKQPSSELNRKLRGYGFKEQTKAGRDYEDISFIMRYSHPIDKFSGSDPNVSPPVGDLVFDEPVSYRKARMEKMFNNLKNAEGPYDFITAIRLVPMECQIVTAPQHLYNISQRPMYQYPDHFFDRRQKDDTLRLSQTLETLKLNLAAASHSIQIIHSMYGIRYDIPIVDTGKNYNVRGRIPAALSNYQNSLSELNKRAFQLIGPTKLANERDGLFDEFMRRLNEACDMIASEFEFRTERSLLDFTFDNRSEMTKDFILFWALQRIFIQFFTNILIFSDDIAIKKRTISDLEIDSSWQPEALDDEGEFSAETVALFRLFRKVEATDRVIVNFLRNLPHLWAEISPIVFCDPLIAWRYAAVLYKVGHYHAAAEQMEIGINFWADIRSFEEKGQKLEYDTPDEHLFKRRRVEYKICESISKSDMSKIAQVDAFDIGVIVGNHAAEWNAVLQQGMDSDSVIERARSISYRIIISLFHNSLSGLDGRAQAPIDPQIATEFFEVSGDKNELDQKAWWWLARAILHPSEAANLLEKHTKHTIVAKNYPVEWRRLHDASATLIRMWIEKDTIASRETFVLRSLRDVASEIRAYHNVSDSSKKISDRLAEITNSLERNEKDKAKREQRNLSKFLTAVASEGAAKLMGEGLSHMLRIILGA